jgi:DNA-binding transcriptional ArsR family regulator
MNLCEDCYLEEVSRPQVCDPWAAYNAQSFRENMGLEGEAGLTDLQQALYQFVKERGKVGVDELLEAFDLSQNELMTSFAVLRHCGLVRAYKENDMVYLTTFDQE